MTRRRFYSFPASTYWRDALGAASTWSTPISLMQSEGVRQQVERLVQFRLSEMIQEYERQLLAQFAIPDADPPPSNAPMLSQSSEITGREPMLSKSNRLDS